MNKSISESNRMNRIQLNLKTLNANRLLEYMPSADSLDKISIEIALQYSEGQLSFEEADMAVNGIWSFICSEEFLDSNDRMIPEITKAVFEAFDQGEFWHKGDAENEDPEVKYTKPLVQQIIFKHVK